ncbi:TorF family putative porin [Gammaproteobacteria bacterium]|nr:TorF family putative porin [Gammaproteobacteria bacterium]
MKIFIRLFIFLLFHFAAFSENEINLSLNSDSIWRGMTQNNGEPTIGADINFSLENGFFSGAWIENCCSETSSYPTREIGFFAGYEKSFTENLAISFNYIGTNYPNSKTDNYDEIELNFSFYNFEISYFKGLDDFPDYYELSYSYDFLNNSAFFSYGDFDSYKNNNTSNGSNYSFGIDSLVKDFTFSFFYYYFNSNGLRDLDDDGVVFSISKKTSF